MKAIYDGVKTYYESIERSRPLSREEEIRYAKLARMGDIEARDKLVEANLRFVVSAAKEYQGLGLTLNELISEGNLGLLEAAERFDETRGFKFISYAVWWIRQAILKALAEQDVRRKPNSRTSDATKLSRVSDGLTQELGREPTLEELAEGADLSMVRVTNAANGKRYTESLDKEFGEGNGRNLLDTTRDETAEDPFMYTAGEEYKAKLRAAERELDERELKIIRLYFGLDDRKPLTLEQIGDMLGLTRERIRQIRDRALEKMRQRLS